MMIVGIYEDDAMEKGEERLVVEGVSGMRDGDDAAGAACVCTIADNAASGAHSTISPPTTTLVASLPACMLVTA